MIVLDLEWNRSYDKNHLDEILQIGAVRVEFLGGPIVDTFCVFIKPVVHRRFDPGARKLPELQASVTSAVSFPAAAEQFRTWCGEETVFAAWGGGDDFKALDQNCAYWGIPPVKVKRVLNFQQAFSRLVGTGQQVALWRAVEYCGIPDIFDYHNALCDALYTAVIGEWLTPDSLIQQPAGRKKRKASPRLSRLTFPRQPRRKIGPFLSCEEILNARASRQPACPVCGKTGGVSRWSYAEPKQTGEARTYYSAFRCAEHGRFLCRLTLSPTEGGGWVARRTVPAITPEVMREYEAARQGGVFFCQKNIKYWKKHRA